MKHMDEQVAWHWRKMITLWQTLERKVHESRWFILLIDQSNFTGSTISIHPVCKLPYLHLCSVPLGALTQINKLKVSSLCEFVLILAVRNVDTYNNHQQWYHGNQNGQDGYQCGCWGNHRLWWNCVCVFLGGGGSCVYSDYYRYDVTWRWKESWEDFIIGEDIQQCTCSVLFRRHYVCSVIVFGHGYPNGNSCINVHSTCSSSCISIDIICECMEW